MLDSTTRQRAAAGSRAGVQKTLSQPLSEELDNPLARLIRRMAVNLADLKGQHRMRSLAETVHAPRARERVTARFRRDKGFVDSNAL